LAVNSKVFYQFLVLLLYFWFGLFLEFYTFITGNWWAVICITFMLLLWHLSV